MFEQIRDIKSGKRELRQFGIAVGIVLGLLGGLLVVRGKVYYFYFLILSGAFLFLGLSAPITLKPIEKIWMGLTILMGWLITRIILILLFYLVVTPIGILARMFGKAFLDTRFDRSANSYWITREAARLDKRSYENQF